MSWMTTPKWGNSYTAPCNIVFEGDSTTIQGGANSWPSQAMAPHPAAAYVNQAAGGDNIDQILAGGLGVITQLQPDVVFFWAGTNDLVQVSVTGETAAQMYADIAAWLVLVRAAAPGAHVVNMTIVPMTATAAGTPQGQLDTLTGELNALIVANSAGFDTILDLSADPGLQVGTPGRASDGIHYTTSGNSIIAGYAAPTLAAFC